MFHREGLPELIEKLGGWANMMYARYGHPVYLVGSTLTDKPDPCDVDLCIELPDDEFNGRFGDWNTLRSTNATDWSDKNRTWASTISKESRWLASRTGINADFKIRCVSWIDARHTGKPKIRLDQSPGVIVKPWYETDAYRDLSRIIPQMHSKIATARVLYGHGLPKDTDIFAPLESSITELMVLRCELLLMTESSKAAVDVSKSF